MSSFLPIDLNQVDIVRSNAINVLPPTLSTQVGNQLVGQAGNSVLQDKIAGALADKGFLGGIASKLLKEQGSAFPYKKAVSFMLLDRNRSLAIPPINNIDQFAPGYFFKMLVNPSSFAVTMPNKTIVPVRTLGGWKVQHWYPDIGSIAAEGSIGNMLERSNRDLKDSNAWRSFRKLMGVYQNNGISYPSTQPGQNRKSAQASFTPTAVCIYDRVWYEGYFESLNYTESEETPHTVKYSMSFKFLTYTDLNDIPGLTRERSVDASVFNTITSQFGGQQAIAGVLGGFGG
jgi:hypothetical protein